MPKIILTVGPPGCGKSIWAKLYIETHKAKRVNKDDLRAMMQNGEYNAQDEKVIKRVKDYAIESWLNQGYDVIVDDTNLTPDIFPHMVELANRLGDTTVHEHVFNIEMEMCSYNNRNRTTGVVPEEDWNGMWLRFTHYKRNADYYAPPREHGLRMYFEEYKITKLPLAVIVDLDNTIAIHPHGRSPFDHSKIPDDIPNLPLIDWMNTLSNDNVQILIVSGRSDEGKKVTEQWLADLSVPYDHLWMRPASEPTTKDHVIKKQIYEELIKDTYFVIAVYEDREQTTAGWRALGLPVYQVEFGRY